MAHAEKTAIVFGAGSGIGAALTDRLASHPGITRVLAVSRRATSSVHDSVCWLEIDAVQAPATSIRSAIEVETDRLDLVFVTIGVLHDGEMEPEKSVDALRERDALRAYQVNALAPLKVCEACLPLTCQPEPSSICVLSAKVGSIGDNRLGGWYSYRMSKAALNMGVKTLARESAARRNHPVILSVHPGTTQTPLSNRYLRGNRAFASVNRSADRLIDLACRAERSQHGAFVNWDGEVLPW